MSKSMSNFAAKIVSALVSLCAVTYLSGTGAATTSDDNVPTTTTTTTTTVSGDGNPWHG